MSPSENSIYCMQTSSFFPHKYASRKKPKTPPKTITRKPFYTDTNKFVIGNSYFIDTLQIRQL